MSAYRNTMSRLLRIACLGALGAGSALAVEFALEDDRLTLKAERAPLREVLQRFADSGVLVKMDPDLDVLVTGSCADAPVDEALDALLQPFAYVALWELVPGPVSNLPRLAEIQVYRPGSPDRAAPLPAEPARLNLVRGPLPDSPWFVADEVLVRVRGGTRLEEFRLLLKQLGATVTGSLPELGVYQLRLPQGVNVLDLVEQLKRNPMLAGVEPNFAKRLDRSREAAPDDAVAGVAAPGVLAGAPPLAILDSGLLAGVGGLEKAVVGQYNAVFPKNEMGDPQGHGTQMALVAAGAVQPQGVAADGEGPPLLAVRAFDEEGATSNFAIMRALQYALSKGARVVNLSWGTETDSAFLADAIAYAQQKGAVIVAAAGNEPTGRAVYPAAYDGVIAVSALNGDGSVWDQSNRGAFVTVSAPGRATLPVGHAGPPGSYAGTSIASAYVARELALYFARNPQATAADARKALQQAVTDAGAKGRDPLHGHGALDAAAARRLRGL